MSAQVGKYLPRGNGRDLWCRHDSAQRPIPINCEWLSVIWQSQRCDRPLLFTAKVRSLGSPPPKAEGLTTQALREVHTQYHSDGQGRDTYAMQPKFAQNNPGE
jgi:hypothetical protein